MQWLTLILTKLQGQKGISTYSKHPCLTKNTDDFLVFSLQLPFIVPIFFFSGYNYCYYLQLNIILVNMLHNNMNYFKLKNDCFWQWMNSTASWDSVGYNYLINGNEVLQYWWVWMHVEGYCGWKLWPQANSEQFTLKIMKWWIFIAFSLFPSLSFASWLKQRHLSFPG